MAKLSLHFIRVKKKSSNKTALFSIVTDSIRFKEGSLFLTMLYVPVEDFVKQHKLYSVTIEIIEGSEKYEIEALILRVKGDENKTILLLRIFGN